MAERKARGTTIRALRIDDERWDALGEAAPKGDRSAVVRALIDGYVSGDITLPPAQ